MKLFTAIALGAILSLAGCAALGMTPEQRESARVSLTQQREVGNITEAQYDAAIEALDNPESFDWETLLLMGGSVLTSIFLGVPVAVGAVQRKRGPVATQQERMVRAAAPKPA